MDIYAKMAGKNKTCIDPCIVARITKDLTRKDPADYLGWMLVGTPCTLRESRCLQQEGVLPSCTLALQCEPPCVPEEHIERRTAHWQDMDALTWAFKATIRPLLVNKEQTFEQVVQSCFNIINVCDTGCGGPSSGAPIVYRVLLLGPKGSGRHTQAKLLAEHFNLVLVSFKTLLAEAKLRKDSVGKELRASGATRALFVEIVKRKLLDKECQEYGYVLIGYPDSIYEFESLDEMPNPPNRIIFLRLDVKLCRSRLLSRARDWCTGLSVPTGHPRARRLPQDNEKQIDCDLENYISVVYPDLRAAAGLAAAEVDASGSLEQVQTALQAAVMSSPMMITAPEK